jgi:hypothetical protein
VGQAYADAGGGLQGLLSAATTRFWRDPDVQAFRRGSQDSTEPSFLALGAMSVIDRNNPFAQIRDALGSAREAFERGDAYGAMRSTTHALADTAMAIEGLRGGQRPSSGGQIGTRPSRPSTGVSAAFRNDVSGLGTYSSQVLRRFGVNPLSTTRLRAEMSRSAIGRAVLDAADEGEILLHVSDEIPGDPHILGESWDNYGVVYARHTQSYARTTQTLIHEGVHALGVGGSVRAEVLARVAEVLHTEGRVTLSRLKQIYDTVRVLDRYRHLPRRVGRTSPLFPGIEF